MKFYRTRLAFYLLASPSWAWVFVRHAQGADDTLHRVIVGFAIVVTFLDALLAALATWAQGRAA